MFEYQGWRKKLYLSAGAEGSFRCNSTDRKRGGKVITSTYGREDRITSRWSGRRAWGEKTVWLWAWDTREWLERDFQRRL